MTGRTSSRWWMRVVVLLLLVVGVATFQQFLAGDGVIGVRSLFAPSSIGTNEARSEPPGAVRATASRGDPRVSAAWVSTDVIVITTWGSGSCPTRPVDIDRNDASRVAVKVRRTDADKACTADLGPTSNHVRLPKGVAVDRPLVVVIDDGSPTNAQLTLEPPPEAA